jgi:hypothetical protein
VKVNTPFKVSFVLENAEVKKPEFPKFIESVTLGIRNSNVFRGSFFSRDASRNHY